MKYLRIILLYSNDVFQQRARSFVWFLLSLILPVVTLFFWQGAFSTSRVIGGWTIAEMRSYYLLAVIAGSMLMAHIELWIAYNQIKNGELSANLMKPLTFLWLAITVEIPWRLVQGFFGIVTLIAFILFGLKLQLTSDPAVIFLGFLIAASALFLSFLLKFCVSMLAFWLTDINALLETQEVLILVFAGLILPVELLPWNLGAIAQFTPFPYIIYYPVVAFVGRLTSDQLLQVLLTQWVWIGVLYTLQYFLWKRGVYKFSGVGQ